MDFFSKIDAYRNEPKIREYLNTHDIVLLTKRELGQYIEQAPLSLSRPSRHDAEKQVSRLRDYQSGQLDAFMRNVADEICGENQIGEEYGMLSAQSAIGKNKKSHKFDSLFIAKRTYANLSAATEDGIVREKMSNILGFVYTELGECANYPNAATINLICARPGTRASVLLGAYLCMIKHNPRMTQLGILELASGYVNVAGLCSYNKFGFQGNAELLDEDCFPSDDNLPMSVYLGDGSNTQLFAKHITTTNAEFQRDNQEITVDDIIEVVVQNKPISRIHRIARIDLCNEFMPDRGDTKQHTMQRHIATMYNDRFREHAAMKHAPSLTERAARTVNRISSNIMGEKQKFLRIKSREASTKGGKRRVRKNKTSRARGKKPAPGRQTRHRRRRHSRKSATLRAKRG
jgi:hypothetical protein